MYPYFEHEMAMGLGDEFNGNAVYAYQLADFANSCQLARPLLINRLNHLIKKLIPALDSEIKLVAVNTEERDYLQQYQSIVYARCEHMRKKTNEILSVRL